MHFETFKNIAIFSTHFFVFCVGVEHGLVIPNILEYLYKLGAQHEAILGIAVAGYAAANCLSARLMRRTTELWSCSRALMVFSNASYVSGGLLYSLTGSWWGVVLGRCCCGLGSGALCVILKDVSRNVLDEEVGILQTRLLASLALGWISASLLGLKLQDAVPGFVCTALFLVCGLLSAAGLCDLGRTLRFARLRLSLSLAYERSSLSSRYGAIIETPSLESSNEECVRIQGLRVNQKTMNALATVGSKRLEITAVPSDQSELTKSDELLETAEGFMGQTPLRKPEKTPMSAISSPPGDEIQELEFPNSYSCCRKRVEIQGKQCLGPHFLTAFLFGCLQTMLTPLTNRFFGFGSMENAVAQLLLVTVGLLPAVFATQGTDTSSRRCLQVSRSCPSTLTAYLLAAISLCWMLAPALQIGNVGSLTAFSFGMIGLSLSCGILFASCSPLELDTTHWTWVLGAVLGPLWAASTTPKPSLLLGLQLCLVILVVARFLWETASEASVAASSRVKTEVIFGIHT